MKKIMFNDKYGLTQAVLAGIKTQTRRIVSIDLYNRIDWKAVFEGEYKAMIDDDWDIDIRECGLYKTGDVVAIAQSYKDCGFDPQTMMLEGKYRFRCDTPGWKNKMFVKALQMPHHIRITNVRVEQLKNISRDDCIKEGVWGFAPDANSPNVKFYSFDADQDEKKKRNISCTPEEAYAKLIDKISGKGTWNSNPWVFVYDFELVK